MSYEESLAAIEAMAETAIRAGESTLKQLRELSRAAKRGDLRSLTRQREQAVAGARELASTTQGLDDDVARLVESITRDSFPSALAAELRRLGFAEAQELDGRVYVYPYIIQFDPANKTVKLGRRSERGLRPSNIGRLLTRLQGSPSDSLLAARRFLDSLERAYLLQTGGIEGRVVLLKNIYDIFVMRPGQRSEYSESDFVRDLYGLDASGTRQTSSGLEISFAAATTTRRGRGYRVVTREGQERVFSAIRFDRIPTISPVQ